MIKLIRIDERLIHGQVVVGWSKNYNITHIIVANDNAANDNILSKTLRMAAPAGVKVAVKTVDEALTMINDPRGKNASIMVIINNPKDAYHICKEVPEIKELNIGNYGRLNATNENREMLSAGLYANDEDKLWFKKLIDLNIDCFVQMTLDQKREDLKQLI